MLWAALVLIFLSQLCSITCKGEGTERAMADDILHQMYVYTIWGPFQAITNNCEQQRKQLWLLCCRIHLSYDLLLSADSKSTFFTSTHKKRCHKQVWATPSTVSFEVRASFIPHSSLALALKGFKSGSHNKSNKPQNNIRNRSDTVKTGWNRMLNISCVLD